MKKTLLITILYCAIFSAFSQINNTELPNNIVLEGFKLRVKMGAGLSRFLVPGFYTEDYLTPSFRLGGEISRNIYGDRLQIESGLNLFFRTQSNPYYFQDRNAYYGSGGMLLLLEKTAVENHFAVEIPLSLRYQLNYANSVNFGVMLRQWQAKKRVDLLASQTEVGVIASIDQRIYTNLVIGLEVFKGFKDLYPVMNVGRNDVIINNQAAIITIGYQL